MEHGWDRAEALCAAQMFNPNPDPEDVAKAKEALKVCPSSLLCCALSSQLSSQ